jgi:antitoxin VapB
MATARVFKSGNSQAVRLPKEFRFKGDEVEIYRRGEEVVLREAPRGMERALEIIQDLPSDMFENIRDERRPPKRDGL